MITYRAVLSDNARFGRTGVHMAFETRGGLKGAVDHATADECIAAAEAWIRKETGDNDVRPEAIIGLDERDAT